MKKQLLSLGAACLALIVTTNVFAQEMTVPGVAAGAITVDAYADEWTGDWIALEKASASSSTDAMSSQIQLAHDEENIYIIIETNDASPNSDASAIPNSWERDCSEIFFSMHEYIQDSNSYKLGDWQIRIQRSAADAASYVDGTKGGGNISDLIDADGFEWAVEDDGSVYITEAAFPKSVLDAGENFDGTNLYFEVQIADNTTAAGSGRTQQMFWMDASDLQWNDISKFTHIELGEIISDIASEKVELAAFVAKDKIYNNTKNVLEVYNTLGSLVLESRKEVIDVATLTEGVYILKSNNLSKKVVIR